MKRILALILALVMCLSLCACGDKAQDVAKELEGTWIWDSGVASEKYIFSNVDGNAGQFKKAANNYLNNSASGGGSFGVNGDGTIDLTLVYEDTNGKMVKRDPVHLVLKYTYEDGKLSLFSENGVAEFTKK